MASDTGHSLQTYHAEVYITLIVALIMSMVYPPLSIYLTNKILEDHSYFSV